MNWLSCVRWSLLLTALLSTGCETPPPPVAAPRPVSVLTLSESDPGQLARVTGTVTSWKTDKLGFEVDGRVQFVIEPETDISGQVYNKAGDELSEGTLLARLDPTRYKLAVESARAQIVVAKKQREAAQIGYDQAIPAQQKAATARRNLARADEDRNRLALASNAISAAEYDIFVSRLQETEAELIELAADREAKASEIASIDARIQEFQESLKQAQRDLDDCQLYSSFAGQVADIHVIPGSFVRQGQAAVTVQMMDPIKVEIEVSSATARRLNHRDLAALHIPQLSGQPAPRQGFVYMIDPVADPLTRTFTVTVMMRNKKVHVSVPERLEDQPLARAGLIGKVLHDLPHMADGLYVNDRLLHEDEQGFYLWRILNRRIGATPSTSDPVLNVEKIRVVPGDVRLSFLGLASLRDIAIQGDTDFQPEIDMLAGDVRLPDGHESWDGNEMLFDRERWLVRPGDLVGVDLSGRVVQPGIYVPLDAIMSRSGSNFVFVVSESEDGDSVRRVEVNVYDTVGTLRRIEAAGEQPLAGGMKVVAGGAAFLVHGENVNVAREVELGR